MTLLWFKFSFLITLLLVFVVLVSCRHVNELSSVIAQANQQELACEGSDMNLMCGIEQGINVMSAFWGRNDTKTCELQAKGNSPKTNIPCTPYCSTYPLEKVRTLCNKKQFCTLSASTAFFELPLCCPNVLKYLKVGYSCHLMSGFWRRKNCSQNKYEIRNLSSSVQHEWAHCSRLKPFVLKCDP